MLGFILCRRYIVMLLMGFASGVPLALSGSTLFIWLTEEGVDLGTVGLFAALGTPYVIKFLWSPLVDHMKLPMLTSLLGRRRAWILFSQMFLIIGVWLLGQTHPASTPYMAAACALLVAFFSATQDIAIDALRIESFKRDEQANAVATYIYGYRIGMLASGAGALYVASSHSWSFTYIFMAGLLFIGVAATFLAKEPLLDETRLSQESLRDWIKRAVLEPFSDFLRRSFWPVILIFILLFKLGDALAGVMTNPFLLEMGFSKIEIANIVKFMGTAATLLGLGAGGLLMTRAGLFKSLLFSGFCQLVSNLMFVVLALGKANLGLLAAAIALENFSAGMGTAVFTAYLSLLCNVRFTATQYALFSSFAALPRTLFSAPAGYMASAFGWAPFFLVTTLAAVPGLLLVLWLRWLQSRQTKENRFF